MSKYSTEELMQCVYDCVTDGIEGDWEEATMRADFTTEKVHVEFDVKRPRSDSYERIQLKNLIAPTNAMIFFRENEQKKGELWNVARVKLLPNGEKKIYRAEVRRKN